MDGCNCDYCKVMNLPIPAAAGERRSRRLAAKPRVSYYDPAIPSEATIRRRDQAKEERKAERNMARMVAHARAVQAKATAAADRQDQAKRSRIERLLAQLDQDAAIMASMPSTPPRLQRQAAVAPWAPIQPPALSHTEATGCALPPPPPLRRTCASPDCDEWCRRCRHNDWLDEYNRNRPLPPGPASVPNLFGAPAGALAPPPIGATVVRIPIDMRLMSAAALHSIIAAANAALGGI